MLKKFVSAISFAMLLIILPNLSLAEYPFIEWVVSDYSTSDGKLAIDSNGNVYKAIMTTELYRGALSITVKYDTNGNKLWASIFETGYSSVMSSVDIAIDSSDNVYVSAGNYGIIKYNKDGEQQWVRRYGDYRSTFPLAMTVDNDGNVYVSGSRSGYDKTVKYDTHGNIIWEADNNASYLSRVMAIDQQRNVYVAIGEYGSVIIKFDANGNKLWSVNYGSGFSWARGISVDTAGNVHVVGIDGSYNMVTMKIGTNGKELWKKVYNGPSTDWGNDIALDKDGNVYVTGQSSPDFITIKYDSNGRELWANKFIVYGGQQGGGGNTIAVDSKGNVYTSGYNNNYSSSMTNIMYDNCGNQLWVYGRGGVMAATDSLIDKEDNLYVHGAGASSIIKYRHALEYNSSCGLTGDTSTGDSTTGDDVSYDSLLNSINKMIDTSCITDKGIANEIQSSLNNAMESANKRASLNMLEALINKISAQTGKGICSEGAKKLIADINTIILQ